MRILVTGGAGFIGTHLVERLLKADHNVEVWDNYSTSNNECLNFIDGLLEKYKTAFIVKKVRLERLNDILDEVYPDRQPDLIFHLASQPRIQPSFNEPEFTLLNNILGTINILEFSRIYNGIPVILAGSSSCTANFYRNPYSFSKHTQEELCQLYQTTFNIPCCIARFYNVYGPRHTDSGDYATVIAIFEKQYKNGLPLTVVGSGLQKRSFTHVDDIVEGLIKICKTPQLWDCQIVDLGYNKVWSIWEVAKMFNRPVSFLPERKGEADITEFKITSLPDWKAKIDLEDYIKSKCS